MAYSVPERPLKILILKPSSLGDVIQAIPVLRLIKRHSPKSRIYWWIESGLAGLLEGDPDLEGVILFERDNWASVSGLSKLWSDIRWMRQQHFDLVIDLQSLARSGAIAWLANGSFTLGLDDPREGAPCFFDAAVPRAGYKQHAVDWYLATLRRLQIPIGNFNWLPPHAETARQIRAKWPVEAGPWIIIQPGARWQNKRWPAESYAEAVRLLAAKNPDIRFAILGSKEDKAIAEIISAAAPARCLTLTGDLTLAEMIEWIRASVLMISNDTGPMHVAAALKKPIVAIFGPTNPARTGPYGQIENALRVQLDCAPCMTAICTRKEKPLECLTSITPQKVARAAQGHIEASRRRAT